MIGSAHCFDPTFAGEGTYSDGGLCFAAHAIYSEHLRPCRSSVLAPPPDRAARALPAVGGHARPTVAWLEYIRLQPL